MAYKISDYGGYGTGALGAVLNPSGQVNSYANVTTISTNTVIIGTANAGIYETFVVGKEVMLHVSAITSGTDYQYLGKYMLATITAVNGSTLTLSKNVSSLVASGVFANHHVQILTVAQFDTLNLTSSITPPAYSVTNKYGGILAFKCKTAFNYSGSAAINLVAKGIPIANVAYRPATEQETNANQMGWENHITSRNMYLNCPDGAAFIAAKASTGSETLARFGGTTAGVARYPYYSGSLFSTSNTAIKGGPTILWVSDSLSGFDPSVISKTSSNTSGRGLGRAYIATNSKIPADECLYAVDCVNNPARLSGMGIKNFGTGALGTVLTLNGQINSYAPVTAISTDGKTITIGTKYEGVYEKFAAGSVVMFHVSRQTGSDNSLIGKFILATVLAISGSTIVLDTAVTNVVTSNVLSNYKCQLVTIAQFDTLANSAPYTGAKAYNDTDGCGGILAMAAKKTMDLSGGILDMSSKGIPLGVYKPDVVWQSSGQQSNYLPLNQGSGAIFLLSKNMTFSSTSRLGSALSGAGYGGTGGSQGEGNNPSSCGPGSSGTQGGAGYGGGGAGCGGRISAWTYKGGYGGLLGGSSSDDSYTLSDNTKVNGGLYFGSKGKDGGSYGGSAGASIFIVADTLTNFNVSLISTGGYGGTGGPAGGGIGGGGGASGTCFVYANTVTNPNYTAVVAS